MSESSIATARQAVLSALDALDAVSGSIAGQDLIDQLPFLNLVKRRAEHTALRAVARLDSEREFTDRGVRPALAVADLMRCTLAESRRRVALASSIFPTSLQGAALEPRLPATATALGGWEIGQAHGEVIGRVLGTDAALTSTTSSCSASLTTTNSTTPAGKHKCTTATPNSFRQNGSTRARHHEEMRGEAFCGPSDLSRITGGLGTVDE
jgi:hypothetical protein